MRLYELLALERRLQNLTYSFEIAEVNQQSSYLHEWSDIPYPELREISIFGENACKPVSGTTCSWLQIYHHVDSLIPHLRNPNQCYLAGFEVRGENLVVYLDS